MDKEQIMVELAALAEQIVDEKTPHLSPRFKGRDWLERWMKIPNIGLGHNTPESVMMEDPERVRQYMRRIEIVPFKKPWGY